MAFSSIVSWEVWNFMSIEHGKCEFDSHNIINLKGYNDSGKSAMLQALKVAIANTTPTKQASFIQDGKDYFRVLITFDDGVQLLRDKYINGQSLYEMYQDSKCIYTTKSQTGALTRVSEVPEPIATYLGLITYENIVLNSRSCFETLIGVQTKGSENYKMFNTVLKSEEIATAGTLLNNDKNKISAEISMLDTDIQSHKRMIGESGNLTHTMIDALKIIDEVLDKLGVREKELLGVSNTVNTHDNIEVGVELPIIDNSKLSAITRVSDLHKTQESLSVPPEVGVVSVSQLQSLHLLQTLISQEGNIDICVEVPEISSSNLPQLIELYNISKKINDTDSVIVDIEQKIAKEENVVNKLQTVLEQQGIKVVRCPNCSHAFASTN